MRPRLEQASSDVLEKVSDAELVERFAQADDEEKKRILQTFYDRYKHLILKVCYGYLKDYDLANDLFHEVFIRIIEGLDKLVNPAVFRSWALMIARNLCVDHLRRTSILKAVEEDAGRISVSYGARTEDRYITEIDRKMVLSYLQACIKQLAGPDLNIFKLRWQGCKTAQIMQLLPMDKADVRRSYDRIKYSLETCMQKKGFSISIDEIIRIGESSEST